jgi:hypothetical protein
MREDVKMHSSKDNNFVAATFKISYFNGHYEFKEVPVSESLNFSVEN